MGKFRVYTLLIHMLLSLKTHPTFHLHMLIHIITGPTTITTIYYIFYLYLEEKKGGNYEN